MRAGHGRHGIQSRHGGGGRRAQSSARSSYFICVRLPEELDSKLHNFVDRNCNSADLLDNRGNQQEIGSGARLDLHVTFTRRVPAGIDKDLIRRVVKEEAAKRSKSPITLTFGSMYCSKVNRIEHSDVQCIGIPLDSPDLDALRTAIASGLEGADKGYAGAGHISMAYFLASRKATYEPLIDSKTDEFAGQRFELKEVELRCPDGSTETIPLYD